MTAIRDRIQEANPLVWLILASVLIFSAIVVLSLMLPPSLNPVHAVWSALLMAWHKLVGIIGRAL